MEVAFRLIYTVQSHDVRMINAEVVLYFWTWIRAAVLEKRAQATTTFNGLYYELLARLIPTNSDFDIIALSQDKVLLELSASPMIAPCDRDFAHLSLEPGASKAAHLAAARYASQHYLTREA
jgi:hypothetical protein